MARSGVAYHVAGIIGRVRREGDEALEYFSEKFDGVSLKAADFRVAPAGKKSLQKSIPAQLRLALERAAENIKAFHKAEMRRLPRSWQVKKGAITTGQVLTPVAAAGMYVPGGRYSYPSTVLMAAIPAKIAGVKRLAMVTPPKNLTQAVLYAAALAGVDEIYRVGGAHAVAALAFGTKTIAKVDLIVGPGNAYVNEAKRQLLGTVGIDALAGPSEVAIIADSACPPEFIAADVSAQAEHDPQARCFVFSDSKTLIAKVKKLLPEEFKSQVTLLECSASEAIARVNGMAPEHLELLMKKPEEIARRITNAGAVFAGYGTPTALGDYWAGPSHVLPTGTSARFSSGLSCATFIKRTSFIKAGRLSPAETAAAAAIAQAEGLKFHSDSIRIREEK